MKDADYLIATGTLPASHSTSGTIWKGFAKTQWQGLTVFATDEGRHPDEGFVSFIARYHDDNRPGAIIERSRFLKKMDGGIISTAHDR